MNKIVDVSDKLLFFKESSDPTINNTLAQSFNLTSFKYISAVSTYVLDLAAI